MQKYDVIVVGAGNGGLSAATYLATAGKKVCPAVVPPASVAAITNLRQRSMSFARWATEKKAVPAAP